MVEHQLIPDWIVCSTAVRACETTELLTAQIKHVPPVDFRSELYLAPPKAYVLALTELNDNVETVLVVGHNPGLESWVEMLGEEEVRFPTAALAHFQLPIDSWSEINTKPHGKLKLLWYPKEAD